MLKFRWKQTVKKGGKPPHDYWVDKGKSSFGTPMKRKGKGRPGSNLC